MLPLFSVANKVHPVPAVKAPPYVIPEAKQKTSQFASPVVIEDDFVVLAPLVIEFIYVTLDVSYWGIDEAPEI